MSVSALRLQCSACGHETIALRFESAASCGVCLMPLEGGAPCDDHTAEVLAVALEDYGIDCLEWDGRSLRGHLPYDRTPRRQGAWRMSELGYFAFVRPEHGPRTLFLTPGKSAARPIDAWRVPLALFVASIATTLWAGWGFVEPLLDTGAVTTAEGWRLAGEFSAAVLFILLSHEFGHWFAARWNCIRATFPYVIPVPLLFGTMGAFIQLRSPAPDRDAMVKLGAAGPLAGMVATILVLAVSLPFSAVVPTRELHGTYLVFGDPLLMKWMAALLGPRVPEGYEIVSHPVVLAGWFGLLVTSLNLLPGGQLDGGHVLRAFLSHDAQKKLTRALAGVLLVLGFLYWPGWYLWAVIIFGFSFVGNPGPTDERPPLSRAAHAMAILTLVTLVVTFCPWPVNEITY